MRRMPLLSGGRRQVLLHWATTCQGSRLPVPTPSSKGSATIYNLNSHSHTIFAFE
jgi:hypothetical protein